MAKMDDLWLVLPHLGPGGAQKVALLAADHFAAQGLRLSLVTLLPGHSIAHPLPEGLHHYDLGPAVDAAWRRNRWNRSLTAHRIAAELVLLLAWPWLSRKATPGRNDLASGLLCWCVRGIGGAQAMLLRDLFRQHQPKRVLTFLSRTNMLVCQAIWDRPIHLVISERNDLSRQSLPFPWQRLREVLYSRADVVTANTEGVRKSLERLPNLQRLELLPNPLPGRVELSDVSSEVKVSRPEGFVTVARLVPQKGVDVLISAIALLSGSASEWPVVLVGDGPERQALEKQAAVEGVQDHVHFEGFRSDPEVLLAAASVFVLPSRFEGMPNALLEAMAAGLAVIVTDASPGPLEVVEDRRCGIVVPSEDPHALAKAMSELVEDVDLRNRLGFAARERLAALEWAQVEPQWRSVLALK
ncbi:MAG: glycosyl transferase family 1 [Gammaproteobacteria bacterium]|nr:glycosyl transferase family 1 [Gammaproteobacteria bacterium]